MVSDEAIAREVLGLAEKWTLYWLEPVPKSGKWIARFRRVGSGSLLDATVTDVDWDAGRVRLASRQPKPVTINWVAGFAAEPLPSDGARTVLMKVAGAMPGVGSAPGTLNGIDISRYPHKCKCGAYAYIGLTVTECSSGCGG